MNDNYKKSIKKLIACLLTVVMCMNPVNIQYIKATENNELQTEQESIGETSTENVSDHGEISSSETETVSDVPGESAFEAEESIEKGGQLKTKVLRSRIPRQTYLMTQI